MNELFRETMTGDTADHRDGTPRLLSRDGVADLVRRIESMVQGGGRTEVRVSAWWRGEMRWARNQVTLASDRRDYQIRITRNILGSVALIETNQTDDHTLRTLVRAVEHEAAYRKKDPAYAAMDVPVPELPYPDTRIWSDTTFNVTTQQRTEVARLVSRDAASHDLLSAGYVELRGSEDAVGQFGVPNDGTELRGSDGPWVASNLTYTRHTQAQCSVTVRHPKGVGSGWAGRSGYEWGVLDSRAIAERALQKCMASLNPVAIEPGRYTVILEPQVVAELTSFLIQALSKRGLAELGRGPFALDFDKGLQLWRSKLGLKVVDERVTITHNPMDPALGVVPNSGLIPVTWIEHGVVKNLGYGRSYALSSLTENLASEPRPSYTMQGEGTTMEEMIATTRRGVVVTRTSSMRLLDGDSLLLTGVTRDGCWLVENGKISKAVRNMRFTDSPLIALNRIEQLGIPTPVFHPVLMEIAPVIVPAIKTSDFCFSATIDSV